MVPTMEDDSGTAGSGMIRSSCGSVYDGSNNGEGGAGGTGRTVTFKTSVCFVEVNASAMAT